MNMDWYISYRFYDPLQEKPKQVVTKRMNQYKTVADRQDDTRSVLKVEMDNLMKGFNPFEKNSNIITTDEKMITLIEGLDLGYLKITVSQTTKGDIGFMLKPVKRAIAKLSLDHLSIKNSSLII